MNLEDGFHLPPPGFIRPSFVPYSAEIICDSPPDLSNVLDSTQWILDFTFSNTSIDTSKLKHLVQTLTTTSRLRGKFAYLLFDKLSNNRDQHSIVKYIIPLLNLCLDKCSRFDLIKPNIFSLSAPTLARHQLVERGPMIRNSPQPDSQLSIFPSPKSLILEEPMSFLSPLFEHMTAVLIQLSSSLVRILKVIDQEVASFQSLSMSSTIPLSALTQLTHHIVTSQDSITPTNSDILPQMALNGLEHVCESHLRLRALLRSMNNIYDLTRQFNTHENQFRSLLYFLYKHAVCRSSISRSETSSWVSSFLCELLKLCLPPIPTQTHTDEHSSNQSDPALIDISELMTQQCKWLYALTRVLNYDRINIYSQIYQFTSSCSFSFTIPLRLSPSRMIQTTLSSALTMTVLLKYGDLTLTDDEYQHARDFGNLLSHSELIRDKNCSKMPPLPATLLSTVWQTYTFIIATLLTIPHHFPSTHEIETGVVRRVMRTGSPFSSHLPSHSNVNELIASPLSQSSSLPTSSSAPRQSQSRFDFPHQYQPGSIQTKSYPTHTHALNQPLSPPLSLSRGHRYSKYHSTDLTSPLASTNFGSSPHFPQLSTPSPSHASPWAGRASTGRLSSIRYSSQPLSPFTSLDLSSPLAPMGRRPEQSDSEKMERASVFSFGGFSPHHRHTKSRTRLSGNHEVISPTFSTISEDHPTADISDQDTTNYLSNVDDDAGDDDSHYLPRFPLLHQYQDGDSIGQQQHFSNDHRHSLQQPHLTPPQYSEHNCMDMLGVRHPSALGSKFINEYLVQFCAPNPFLTKKVYSLRVSSVLPPTLHPRITYHVILSSPYDSSYPHSPPPSISSQTSELSSRTIVLHLLLTILKKRLIEIYHLYCYDFRMMSLIEKENIRLEQLERFYHDPSYVNEWNGATSSQCHAKLYNHVFDAPRSYYLNHIEDTSLYCTQFNQVPVSTHPPASHDPFQTPPQSPQLGVNRHRSSPTCLSPMSPLSTSVFFPSSGLQHVSRLHSPSLSPLSSRYTLNDSSPVLSHVSRTDRPQSPHFSFLSPTSHSSFLSALRVGNYIDAQDTHQVWYMARIVHMSSESITVHYDGWVSTYDEVIDKTMWRYRIAPLGSVVREKNRRRKNESLLFDMDEVRRNLPKWEPPQMGSFPFIALSSPNASPRYDEYNQTSPIISSPSISTSRNATFSIDQASHPSAPHRQSRPPSVRQERSMPKQNPSTSHEIIRQHIDRSREHFEKVTHELKMRLKDTFPTVTNIFSQIASVSTLAGALLESTPLDDHIVLTIQWLTSSLHFSVINHGCLGSCGFSQVYDTKYAIPDDSLLLPHLAQLEKLFTDFSKAVLKNEQTLFSSYDLSPDNPLVTPNDPLSKRYTDDDAISDHIGFDHLDEEKEKYSTAIDNQYLDQKLQQEYIPLQNCLSICKPPSKLSSSPSITPSLPHDPYCNLQKSYLDELSHSIHFDYHKVYIPPALYRYIANLVCGTLLGASRMNHIPNTISPSLFNILTESLQLLTHLSDSSLWISSQIRLTNHLLAYSDTPDERSKMAVKNMMETPTKSTISPKQLQSSHSNTVERKPTRSFFTPQQNTLSSPHKTSSYSPGRIFLEDLPHPTVDFDDGFHHSPASTGHQHRGIDDMEDLGDIGDIADLPDVVHYQRHPDSIDTNHQYQQNATITHPNPQFIPFYNSLSYQLSKSVSNYFGESFAFITVGDDPSSVICSRRDIQRLILETLRGLIIEAHPTKIGLHMRLTIQSRLVPIIISSPDILNSLLLVLNKFPKSIHQQLFDGIDFVNSIEGQPEPTTLYKPTAASIELPLIHQMYPQADVALDVFASFRPLLQPGVTVKAFLPPQLDPVTAQVLSVDYAEQSVCVKFLDSIPDLDAHQSQQGISKTMSDHYLPISCIVPITDRPGVEQHNLDCPEHECFLGLIEEKVRHQIAFVMNIPHHSVSFRHSSLTYFMLQSITCSLLIHHAICRDIFSGYGVQQHAYHLHEEYQITSLIAALISSLQHRLFGCFTSLSKNIDIIDCLETSIEISSVPHTGTDSPTHRVENQLFSFIQSLSIDCINNLYNLPGRTLFEKFILLFPTLQESRVQPLPSNLHSKLQQPSDLDTAVGNYLLTGREECPILPLLISQAISVSFDGHIISHSTRPPRLLSLLPAVSLPHGSLDIDIVLLKAPTSSLPMPELQDVNLQLDKIGVTPTAEHQFSSAPSQVPAQNVLTIPPLLPHIHQLPKLPRDRFIATLPVTPMINAANSVISTSTAPFPTPLDATMRDVASGAFVRERMVASRFAKKLSISSTLMFNLSHGLTSDTSMFSPPETYDQTLPSNHPNNHSLFTKLVNHYVQSRLDNILIGTHVKMSPKATAAIQQILCGFNPNRSGVIVDVFHCQLSSDVIHHIPVQVKSPEVDGAVREASTGSRQSTEQPDPALFSPAARPQDHSYPPSQAIPSPYTRRKSLLLASNDENDYVGTSAEDYIKSTLNIIETEQQRKPFPPLAHPQQQKQQYPDQPLTSPPLDISQSDGKFHPSPMRHMVNNPVHKSDTTTHRVGLTLRPSAVERSTAPVDYDTWNLPSTVPVTTGVGCVLVHFPPMLPDNRSILNSAFDSSNRNSTLALLLNNFELHRQHELGLYTRIDDITNIISHQMHTPSTMDRSKDEASPSQFSRIFLDDRGSLYIWLRLNDIEPLSEKQSPYIPELYLSSNHDFFKTTQMTANHPPPFASAKEIVDLNQYGQHICEESLVSRSTRHLQFILKKRPQTYMHFATSQYRHTICLYRSWMLSKLGIGHEHKFSLDRPLHHFKFIQRVLFGGFSPIIPNIERHPYFKDINPPLLTIPRLLKLLPTAILPSEIIDHSAMPESFRDRIPHKKESYLVPTSLSPRIDNVLTLTTSTGRDSYPYNINGFSPWVPSAIRFLSQLLLMQTRAFRAPLYHNIPTDEMIGEWNQFDDYVDPFASDSDDSVEHSGESGISVNSEIFYENILNNAYMARGPTNHPWNQTSFPSTAQHDISHKVPFQIVATPIDDMLSTISRACYELLHWYTHPGVSMTLISFNKLAIRLRIEFKPMVILSTSLKDPNNPNATISMPSSSVTVSHIALSFSQEFTKKSCLIRIYRDPDFSDCINDIHFTTASETSPSTITVPSPCYIQYTLLDEDFIQVESPQDHHLEEHDTVDDGDVATNISQTSHHSVPHSRTAQTVKHTDPPFYHMFPDTSSVHGTDPNEPQIHLYYLPSFVLNNISIAPYPPHCLNMIHACLQAVIELSGRPGISAYYRTKIHSMILVIIDTLTACGLNDYLLNSAVETKYNNISTTVNPLFEILRTRSEHTSTQLIDTISTSLSDDTHQGSGLSKDQQRALNQLLGEIIPQFSSLCSSYSTVTTSGSKAPGVSSHPFPIYHNDLNLVSSSSLKHSSSATQKQNVLIAHKLQHLLSQSLTVARSPLHFAFGISPTRSTIVKLLSKALFSITSVPVPLQTPPLLAFKHHFRQCQWIYSSSSSIFKTIPAALQPQRRSMLVSHGQRVSLQRVNSLPIRKPISPQSTSKLREGGITQNAPLVHPLFRLRDNIFVEFSNQLEFESSRGQSLMQRRQPVHIKGHLCPFVLFKSKYTECCIEFVSAMEYALTTPWGQVSYHTPPPNSPFYQHQNSRESSSENNPDNNTVEYEFISWFHQCSLHVQLWQSPDGNWFKYSPDDFNTFNHFIQSTSKHTVPLSEEFFCLVTDNMDNTFFCLVDNDLPSPTTSHNNMMTRSKVDNKSPIMQHIPFLNQGKDQNTYSYIPLGYQLCQSIVHRRLIRTIPLYHYTVLRQSPSLISKLFMSMQSHSNLSSSSSSSSSSSLSDSNNALLSGSLSSRTRPASSTSFSSKFVHPSVIEGITSFYLPSSDSILFFLSSDDYNPQSLEDQLAFFSHSLVSNITRRELNPTPSPQYQYLLPFIQTSSLEGLTAQNDTIIHRILQLLQQRMQLYISSSLRSTYKAKTNPIFNRIHHASSMIRHAYYRVIPPILLTLYNQQRFVSVLTYETKLPSDTRPSAIRSHAHLLGLAHYELLPPDDAYTRRRSPAVGDDAITTLTETEVTIDSSKFNFPINDPYLLDICQQPIIDSACMIDLSYTSSIRIPYLYLRHPIVVDDNVVEPIISVNCEGSLSGPPTQSKANISLDTITAKVLMPHVSRRMLLFDLNLMVSGRIAPDQTPVVKLEVPLELDDEETHDLQDSGDGIDSSHQSGGDLARRQSRVSSFGMSDSLPIQGHHTPQGSPPLHSHDGQNTMDTRTSKASPLVSLGAGQSHGLSSVGTPYGDTSTDVISLLSSFFPGVVSDTFTLSWQQQGRGSSSTLQHEAHATTPSVTDKDINSPPPSQLTSPSSMVDPIQANSPSPIVDSPSQIIQTLEEPELVEMLDNMLFNTFDLTESLQYPDPLTTVASPLPDSTQQFGFNDTITQEDDRNHDPASLIEPLIVQLSRRLRESRNHHLRVLSGSYALRVIYSGLSNIGAVGFPGPFRQVMSQTLAQLNRISMIPHIVDQSVSFTEKLLRMNYLDIYNENLDWYALEQSLSSHPSSSKQSSASNVSSRMRQMGEDLPQLFVSVANGLNNIGSNRDLLVPNSTATAAGVMHLFMTLGLIIGMGIRTKTSLECNFPSAFWVMLTNTAPRGEYEDEEMLLRFGLLPLYQRSMVSTEYRNPSSKMVKKPRRIISHNLWDIIPFHAQLSYPYYQDITSGVKGHIYSSPPLLQSNPSIIKQQQQHFMTSLEALNSIRPIIHPPLSLLRLPLRLLASLNSIAIFDTRLVQSITDPYFTPTPLLVHAPLANGLSIPIGFAGPASAAINLLPIQRLSYVYGVASLTGIHRSQFSQNPSWSSNSSYHDDIFIPQHYSSQCYSGMYTTPINAIQLGLKSVIPPHCMSLLTSYLKRPRYVHGFSSEMAGNCSQFDLFPLNVITSDEWEGLICGQKSIDITFLKAHTTMKMTTTREQAEERDSLQQQIQTINATIRDLGYDPYSLHEDDLNTLHPQIAKHDADEIIALLSRRNEIQNRLSSKEEQWQSSFQQIQEWFWEMLSSFDVEKRSSFLQFVWGVSKLPSIMTSQFNVTVVDYGSKDDNDSRLPQSHTCFFLMELPMYSSYDILVRQMTFALTSKDISF